MDAPRDVKARLKLGESLIILHALKDAGRIPSKQYELKRRSILMIATAITKNMRCFVILGNTAPESSIKVINVY